MRCKDCYHYEVCMDYTSLKESEFAQNFNQADTCCGHFVSQCDVVDVVRCKDCKYGEVDENENTWCTFYNGRIREMPNGYCWHGERRTENG